MIEQTKEVTYRVEVKDDEGQWHRPLGKPMTYEEAVAKAGPLRKKPDLYTDVRLVKITTITETLGLGVEERTR